MRLQVAFIVIALVSGSFLNACAEDPHAGALGAAETSSGVLHLPLVTPGDQTFRLSNAVFEVTGPGGAALELASNAADDSAEELTAALAHGTYSIRLRDGWVLERVAADGATSPVRAALRSPNPTIFQIEHQRGSRRVHAVL